MSLMKKDEKGAGSAKPPGSQPASTSTSDLADVLARAADSGAHAAAGSSAWKQAHDALEAALEEGNRSLDQTKDKHQRDLLNELLDTISAELTALNREGMESQTISLQAASQQLGAGIASLKSLRQQLDQISGTIANAAKVVDAVNGVLSGIQAFLGTFPVL